MIMDYLNRFLFMCYDYHFGNLKQIYHGYVCVSIPNPVYRRRSRKIVQYPGQLIYHTHQARFFKLNFSYTNTCCQEYSKTLGVCLFQGFQVNTLRVYHQYTVQRICIFIFLEASESCRFQKLFRLVNLCLLFYPFSLPDVCFFDEILCICQYI